MKFDIGCPNNVANINVSSYSTINKMPTGAKLVNKLLNCLKTYKLFTGDVKISGYVYTIIYGSFVAILPVLPHFKKRFSFVERSTLVLCSRG
jgi:nitrate/nitrite transporter NarK